MYDTTFENVQAGLRTDLLFRAANQRNGMVLGTGNMSELALGWCTYGVGDQMSHYNVNGSLPKTLIQHLVRWTAANRLFDPAVSDVLLDILATTISPELIPQTAEGESQSTEGKIGPYELHDFWIYYLTRFGLRPSKIAFLALHAWQDAAAGNWPPRFPDEQKRAYPIGSIRSWLEVFLQRFFANQFKRSALPNGPKVTTGGSLSPRGDWRMPSDAHGQVWIDELHRNVPEVLDPASDDIPTKEPDVLPAGGKPIVR